MYFSIRSVRSVFAVAAAAFILSLSSPTYAADSDLHSRLDALFAEAYAADEPGAAVIVVRDGETLLREGYGLAHVELGVPVEPDMVFRIGSMTKQFTAVAAMLLAEEGKLSLEAPVAQYLPDYPEVGQGVKVQQLLDHTSGIPSYTGMASWRETVRDPLALEELVDVFDDEALEFEPGTDWKYNNSGYVLLGAVVEAASGMSYEDFVEERLFAPLDMGSSDYGDPGRMIPRRVAGYAGAPGSYRNAAYIDMSHPHAAGALLSTVDDLVRWHRGLVEGKLLKPESLERLWTSTVLPDGRDVHYGGGWALWEYRGHRVVEHGGAINGFLSNGIWLPGEKIYVAVLSNNPGNEVGPDALSIRAAALVLGEPLDELVSVEVPGTVLAEYEGVYQVGEEEGDVRVVTYDESGLISRRAGGEERRPIALSQNEFLIVDTMSRLRFVRDAEGKVTHSALTQRYGPEESARKTDLPIPEPAQEVEVDPAIYDDYVGTYEMRPGMELTIERQEDRLMALLAGQPPVEIFPRSETLFFLKVVDATIEFVRGEDGQVGVAIITQGPAKLKGKRKR